MRLSFDDEDSFKGAAESLCFNNNNPPSDLNSLELRRVGSSSSTSTSMPSQDLERNEDICSQSDLNSLGRVGSSATTSSSSTSTVTPPQERSKDVDILAT